MNPVTTELIACAQGFLEPQPEHLREYVRLFLSPEGAPCPPWQSANQETPALFGANHHSALVWYRQYGFEPKLGSEPADHVGLLLTFAAWLIENGEDPRAFADQHLSWIPDYCARLEKEARTPWFTELAARARQAAASI